MRGRANIGMLLDLSRQDEPTRPCPWGHGSMALRYNGRAPFHLCGVCGGIWEDAPDWRAERDVLRPEWQGARRTAMERVLSWVPRYRAHRAELERWLMQGRGSGALAIFGAGTRVSDPTLDRVVQVMNDPAIAMIGHRLRQIDAVYRQELDPLCRQFASLAYFDSPEPAPMAAVREVMHVSLPTVYRYRETVLDTFAASLPRGWENPQAWWAGSPLEAANMRSMRIAQAVS